MIHSFDIDIAEKYGVFEAILLNNIFYWVEHNRANSKHFYEGRYWTYNSIGAYVELFPYMSKGKIERALKHLEDEGVLVTGNFNKLQTDRTKWYSLTEKGYSIVKNEEICDENEEDSSQEEEYKSDMDVQNEKCISQNQEMDFSKSSNAFLKSEQPLPYINTDSKPDNKTLTESKDSVCRTEVRRQSQDSECSQDIKDIVDKWNQLVEVGINPVYKLSPTSKRYKNLKARIRQYSADDVKRAIEEVRESSFLQGKNKNGWTITFDWFVLPNNFPKVLEGNYADKGGNKDGGHKTSGKPYHEGDYLGTGKVTFEGFGDMQ